MKMKQMTSLVSKNNLHTIFSKAKLGILGVGLFLLSSCTNNSKQEEMQLQEGDIVFQTLQCGDLCTAIQAVTTSCKDRDFNHCGLVVKQGDSLAFLEAIGSEVGINPFSVVFARKVDTLERESVIVARLKPEYRSLIPAAIEWGKKQVGVPYDNPFLMDNGMLYCSELIYEAFKEANNGKEIFTLYPMTFIDRSTNEFYPAWVAHFKEYNMEVIEGALGLSPGWISLSEKVDIFEVKVK